MLNCGDLIDKLKVLTTLGKGTYGYVQLIEYKDTKYALKSQPHLENHQIGFKTSTLKEIDALSRLRKLSQVINLYGICFNVMLNETYLLLEPMEMDLTTYIVQTNWDIRSKYFNDLLKTFVIAETVMLSLNIHHFDISTGNILVSVGPNGPMFKLSDFSLSAGLFPSVASHTQIVTSVFKSPELLAARPHYEFNLDRIDIWSFGIVMYTYITGKHYWTVPDLHDSNAIYAQLLEITGTSQKDILNGTITGHLPLPNLPEDVPDYSIAIMKKMLSLNPKDRPSSWDILCAFGLCKTERDGFRAYITSFNILEPKRQLSKNSYRIPTIAYYSGCSYVTLIVAMEIVTRFFGLAKPKVKDLPYNAAALHLASVYVDKDFLTATVVANAFNVVVGYVNEAELEILETIDYMIYNHGLTTEIYNLYGKHGAHTTQYLVTLPIETWSKPINDWFK